MTNETIIKTITTSVMIRLIFSTNKPPSAKNGRNKTAAAANLVSRGPFRNPHSLSRNKSGKASEKTCIRLFCLHYTVRTVREQSEKIWRLHRKNLWFDSASTIINLYENRNKWLCSACFSAFLLQVRQTQAQIPGSFTQAFLPENRRRMRGNTVKSAYPPL